MNTFESIEEQLPWGFHDALLLRLDVDWLRGAAKMDLRVAMTERQDEDRLGQLTFGDLVFCAIEAPELDETRGYVARTGDGLMVDCGAGLGHASQRDAIPTIPSGADLRWFFVQEWNRFIHICSRSVQFAWLEEMARPRGVHRRALFPGDTI